jgi:copper chaperone CopZ
MKTTIIVKGFHCKSCETLVKDVAEDYPEITSCQVDVKNGEVVLEHKDGFDLNRFKKEIASLGEYRVE